MQDTFRPIPRGQSGGLGDQEMETAISCVVATGFIVYDKYPCPQALPSGLGGYRP